MKGATYRVMIRTLESLQQERRTWLRMHRDCRDADWPRAADIEAIERGLSLPGAITQAHHAGHIRYADEGE